MYPLCGPCADFPLGLCISANCVLKINKDAAKEQNVVDSRLKMSPSQGPSNCLGYTSITFILL